MLDKYAYDIIRRRREDGTFRSKNDALSRFLKAGAEDGEQAYTDKELRDVVLNFLIAGRYVRSSGSCYCFCKYTSGVCVLQRHHRASIELVSFLDRSAPRGGAKGGFCSIGFSP